MQIIDLFSFFTILEISIHYRNSYEKCLIITFKICKNFNHPINHSCSHRGINHQLRNLLFMSQETVGDIML
jgi:hypothetical protein